MPLTAAFVAGLVNWAYLLPATTACIAERRRQEKKDGKMSWDPAPHSDDMAALNKKFGILHGISSTLNVVHFVAAIIYGVTLAGRIN